VERTPLTDVCCCGAGGSRGNGAGISKANGKRARRGWELISVWFVTTALVFRGGIDGDQVRSPSPTRSLRDFQAEVDAPLVVTASVTPVTVAFLNPEARHKLVIADRNQVRAKCRSIRRCLMSRPCRRYAACRRTRNSRDVRPARFIIPP